MRKRNEVILGLARKFIEIAIEESCVSDGTAIAALHLALRACAPRYAKWQSEWQSMMDAESE